MDVESAARYMVIGAELRELTARAEAAEAEANRYKAALEQIRESRKYKLALEDEDYIIKQALGGAESE